MILVAWASALGSAACTRDSGNPLDHSFDQGDQGDAPQAEVTMLVGEIHLHQFPLGSHGWAAFLPEPVPRASVKSDQLVDLESAPTAVEGACTLYVQPRCTLSCTGSTLCLAPDTCTPYTAQRYVDAGEVRVEGSRVVKLISMWFAGANAPYDIDPPAGRNHLFEGGDALHVFGLGDGAVSDLGFDGHLTAPEAVIVTKPDFTQDLHFTNDALELAWETQHSLQIVVTVTASSRIDLLGATIRCSTADGGGLTVPASMMAALPPSPRDIRIEIERNDERVFPTQRPGVGVIVHAAQSSWKDGRE